MSELKPCPQPGDVWKHHKGDLYTVIGITSEPDAEKANNHPRAVFYQGHDGRCWTRLMESWMEIFSLVSAAPIAPTADALYTIDQMREYADNFYLSRIRVLAAEKEAYERHAPPATAAHAGAIKCRDLTEADMDKLITLIGEHERDEIGHQGFCEHIIDAFAMLAAAPTPVADSGAIDDVLRKSKP